MVWATPALLNLYGGFLTFLMKPVAPRTTIRKSASTASLGVNLNTKLLALATDQNFGQIDLLLPKLYPGLAGYRLPNQLLPLSRGQAFDLVAHQIAVVH